MGTTRRASDGTEVAYSDAVPLWAASARPVLERVATTYHAVVTYQELADAVQEETGITPGVPFRPWIGSVLYAVASGERADQPTLTALVLRADGTIGPGYAIPIRAREGVEPDDLDWHAAIERERVYRHYGATIPPGGEPRLPSAVASRRRHRSAVAPKPPPRICEGCRMALPATGVCDFCD